MMVTKVILKGKKILQNYVTVTIQSHFPNTLQHQHCFEILLMQVEVHLKCEKLQA